ncbi:MAG: 23S rRNA (adenine(2503)-C(2))-methyltransferase RlmN [Elusimicrobia bacterium]|nr:23S rRNA (adenine(2503)-C(2))-methyltransferase RlmN [Elusimicrobiota bacterium]
MPPLTLADLTTRDLETLFASWGFKPVHAARLLRHFYARDGGLPAAGRPLPDGLLERLRSEFPSHAASLAARRVAADGTAKLLLRLADGRTVETVLLADFRPDRATACLSSQVGCALGCDFCATGKAGFERDLSSGEMIEQLFALRREAAAAGRRLRNVVFMGMGEPLLNLDAVLAAVRRMADNALGGLGWAQVTVSTVGIVPGIDALTEAGLPINLAVSLHAPDDAARARLLPMARRFSIADILAAADRFQALRGRPVIIQYCLLKGVNDSPGHARALAAWLGARSMHVNLIRYNPTGPGLQAASYEPSDDRATEVFLAELRARGVNAHPRWPRGCDIGAACGQLRQAAR